MKIDMLAIGGSDVLAGALNGRSALNELLNTSAAEPANPEPVFLDFTGIEVATASFLRESVLAFRDIVRGDARNSIRWSPMPMIQCVKSCWSC